MTANRTRINPTVPVPSYCVVLYGIMHNTAEFHRGDNYYVQEKIFAVLSFSRYCCLRIDKLHTNQKLGHATQ